MLYKLLTDLIENLQKGEFDMEKYFVYFEEWSNAFMRYEPGFIKCDDIIDARDTERMLKTGFVKGAIKNVRVLTEREISEEIPNYKEWR